MHATPVLLFLWLSQATPAIDDPQAKAQAQALLSEGTRLYGEGDVAGALEKFQAAYAAFPSPKLMFNIGRANDDLGRPVEAMEAFEKFLAEATDASPETIANANKSASELRRKLGRIRIDCETADAEVNVDGKRVGLTPLPELVWATAGRHQVTAKHASAAPAIEDVDVAAGSVSTVTMRLLPATVPVAATAPKAASDFDLQAATPPGAASEGWWLGRKWTWVAAGSTALLAAGAVTAGLLAQSKFDSLRSSCGIGNQANHGCGQSDIDSVTSRATIANVFWGLAGAAAATTGVLFYFEGRPVSVAPVAGGMSGLIAAMRY